MGRLAALPGKGNMAAALVVGLCAMAVEALASAPVALLDPMAELSRVPMLVLTRKV
jgi:hypothetical protein